MEKLLIPAFYSLFFHLQSNTEVPFDPMKKFLAFKTSDNRKKRKKIFENEMFPLEVDS